MIILGIDPGTAEMGVGLIQKNGKVIEHLHHECIKTSNRQSPEERLYLIHKRILEIIKEYQPKVMAIESLFLFSNAKSVNAVGQAMGAVMVAAGQEKVKVRFYSPLKIKKVLADYGRASKRKLQSVVRKTLRKRKLPRPVHAADALAVALCHLKLTTSVK